MEVRPGYKQTEVGVIPEGWDVRTLRDTSEVVTVGFVGSMAHLFTKNGVPLLRGQNVLPGRIDLTDSKFISAQTHTRWKKSALHEGDVVIVRVGYPGTCAVIPRDFGAANAASLVVVRPDLSCVESSFVCYVLLSDIGRKQVTAALVGGAQQVINIGTAASFLIPVPGKPEQRAIAAALSDVDALLGGLDRLIAKKRDLKQAAMQQLLSGQTRLPGFRGEWKVEPLKHFVKTDRFAIVDGPFGSQLKVDEYVESGIPVIEMEHLSDDMIPERIERCITPKKFEDLKRSAVYPGDIVISKTGSLGKLGLIPDRVERGLITSRLAKITLDPSHADRRFVFQVLLKLRRESYWEKVSQGGTMQILGIGMLQNAPIPKIAVAEQTAIAAVLSDMDAELSALEARRAKTHALKQGMMQELLTGRTRLV